MVFRKKKKTSTVTNVYASFLYRIAGIETMATPVRCTLARRYTSGGSTHGGRSLMEEAGRAIRGLVPCCRVCSGVFCAMCAKE